MTTFTPPRDWHQVKGFLADAEAAALYGAALDICGRGPVLEIGSYCGKSSICLGLACRRQNSLLFALDHHRGSEEHQPGEEFHDPDLYDPQQQRHDSLGEFRRNLHRAGLEDWVVPIVASSERAARFWTIALSMLFIDGGHSLDAALTDYRCWSGHVLRGGILAIHDVFPDPAQGGQAPFTIYRQALESGRFELIEQVESLALLRRL